MHPRWRGTLIKLQFECNCDDQMLNLIFLKYISFGAIEKKDGSEIPEAMRAQGKFIDYKQLRILVN